MAKKHINIPIFIPHLGCPNQCVFCNQRSISGVTSFSAESVIPIIEEALSTAPIGAEAEIAFFGGSFTGIDRDLMIKLLQIANGYIKQGRVSSIRCSTRPDYINSEILDILSEYGVGTVELGLQSYSDKVLVASKRGHTSKCEREACELILSRGIRLGGQMMIGLPSATLEDELATARFIAEVGANEARIYPTVVLCDTELCEMAKVGCYMPLALDSAVERSAAALEILIDAGVKILRIGLCDSENLHSDKTYFGGPNHPAIGELVEGEYYYRIIRERLLNEKITSQCAITIYAPVGQTSKIIGQSKKNKIRILREFGAASLRVVEDVGVKPYSVLLIAEERK